MNMPSLFLQGELRLKNYVIYKLMKVIEEDFYEVYGYYVIEDCRRRSTLEDFDFLKPVYESEEQWDSNENYIHVRLVVPRKIEDKDEISVLNNIGTYLVEFKPSVDVKISIIEDDWLAEYFSEDFEEEISELDLYAKLLRHTEGKPDITSLTENSLNYLSQD